MSDGNKDGAVPCPRLQNFMPTNPKAAETAILFNINYNFDFVG
jgi:hypothetical protein